VHHVGARGLGEFVPELFDAPSLPLVGGEALLLEPVDRWNIPPAHRADLAGLAVLVAIGHGAAGPAIVMSG
jgi:hypothetical protein